MSNHYHLAVRVGTVSLANMGTVYNHFTILGSRRGTRAAGSQPSVGSGQMVKHGSRRSFAARLEELDEQFVSAVEGRAAAS